MQIQINSDSNVDANAQVSMEISASVARALARFDEHITRVEVHLSDENSGDKGGDDDMRCMIEARLEGQRPAAVTHQAATLGQAVDGALHKLTRKLDSSLGKRRAQRGRGTKPGAPDASQGEEP